MGEARRHSPDRVQAGRPEFFQAQARSLLDIYLGQNPRSELFSVDVDASEQHRGINDEHYGDEQAVLVPAAKQDDK